MLIPLDKIEKKGFNLKLSTLAIDTNILFWTFYNNVTYVKAYQKNIYPEFLSNIIEDKRCRLYTTTYNILELFNIIENNEYNLYVNVNNLNIETFTKKKYRQIEKERCKLQKMFKLLYNQISECIEIKEYNITKTEIKEYYEYYNCHLYDVFDFSLLKFCQSNSVSNILTDDIDFASNGQYIANINIITANKNMKI